MLQSFFIIYLIVLAFLGCDNIYLIKSLNDINVLVASLSLAFLYLAFNSKNEKKLDGVRVSALSVTLIIFLLYSAMSFYWSVNADLTGYPALKNLSALFLAIALVYFFKDIEMLKKAFLIIFILAGIHATFGVLQQFIPSLLHQPNRFNSASTSLFFNPNFFSGYLAIYIPIGFYLTVHQQSKYWKIVFAGILGAIYVAIGFSGSPGGQLIAILQVLGLTIFLLKKKDFHHLKILGGGLILALLVYIGLIAILNQSPSSDAIATGGSLIRRPWVWEHMENRFMYWTGAWEIFKENWLFGTGLWTFMELYPQTGFQYFPPHAHNMYIQTAVETGLIGFVLLMICLAVLYLTFVRIFKKGNTEGKNISFYIAVSLSGFLLHNLIEYNWLISNFIYYFVFFVISIEVINRETLERNDEDLLSQKLKSQWHKGLIILIILGAFTNFQYYRYQHIVDHDIPFSRNVEEMSANATRAKGICSRCGKPHYLSGLIYFEAFHQSKNNQYLVQAENAFNDALQRNPHGLGAYLFLGNIKSLQGKEVEARKFYKRAMKDSRYKLSAMEKIKNLEKTNLGKIHES